MIEALNRIEVISLFVEDLSATKDFYKKVFGLTFVYQDDVSTVMKFGHLMINLLQSSQAYELVAPNTISDFDRSSRFMFTINVEDANAVCGALARHGVELLNGPVDRPWGRRTAAFSDPAGNVWEIAQELNVAKPASNHVTRKLCHEENVMCPICITTSALIAFGLGSAGIISTVAAVVLRGNGQVKLSGSPRNSQENPL